MAEPIHARKMPDGTFRYRVWTSIADGYLTDEMNEEELRAFRLERAINRVREDHERDFPRALDTAQKCGSSIPDYYHHGLRAKWNKERR